MARKNDIQLAFENLQRKDIRNEKYYYTIEVGGDDVIAATLISHIDNQTATGAEQFKQLAEQAKKDRYEWLIIYEYKAFKSGSAGAQKPYSQTKVQLLKSKPQAQPTEPKGKFVYESPMEAINDVFQPMGGLQGFMNQQTEHLSSVLKLEALQEKYAELKEKAQKQDALIEKLKADKERWTATERDYEDDLKRTREAATMRSMMLDTGIKSGVAGIGQLLLNNNVISPESLSGLLAGFEQPAEHAPSIGQHDTNQSIAEPVPDVEIEGQPQLTEAQQQVLPYAEKINNWLMRNPLEVAQKVYQIFAYMAASPDNIDELNELINDN